jgi:lipopolysaccharide transport system ATP-binding protein
MALASNSNSAAADEPMPTEMLGLDIVDSPNSQQPHSIDQPRLYANDSPSSSPLTDSGLLAPTDSILSVQNVSKKFCRNLKQSYIYGLQDIFSEVVGKGRRSDRLRNQEFWAVKDVSLEVKRGESIGLVGVNGSGKSTLLRMISGLMKPDTGRIVVKGRVAALIALGTGFNPLLSGRENVFINMAIFGMPRAAIAACFDEVVDFAEVWEAIDAPVRTYSSGMRARLGFACAIFTGPDILLLDEVLAVGDAIFRAKCYRKLAQLREDGTSFFLVSHNSNAVLNLCNTAVFLERGRVIMQDSAEQVISRYEDALLDYKTDANKGVVAASNSGGQATDNPANNSTATLETTELTIDRVSFVDGEGNPIEALSSGKPASICIHCDVHEAIDEAIAIVMIRELNAGDECVLNLSNERDGQPLSLPPGPQEIRLQLPYCGLSPNLYTLKVTLCRRPFYVFDMVESFRFEVKKNKNMNQCQFYQPRDWLVHRQSL